MGDEVPFTREVAGLDVTRYSTIALPPLFVGATNVTVAEAFPAVATTPVGASGAVAGVTAVEVSEEAEEPTVFSATTVKV